MSTEATVLYDAPGPRARVRNVVLTLILTLLFLAVAYFVYLKLAEKGQWSAAKWKPFLQADVWLDAMLRGLIGTLKAAAAGAVLALAFGVLFGLGRLSERSWIRLPAGLVVEFFRAIPVLLLIFFAQYGSTYVFGYAVSAFTAVVFGLTLYNGSVIAEIVRAGVNAVPKGQSEAAYSIGLRRGQVLRLVLLPQAVTAMMPALVSQLVILLKDSALGWIISYDDLLNEGFRIIGTNFSNVIPAAIVTAVIYVAINMSLDKFAVALERRNARRGAVAVHAAAAGTAVGALAAAQLEQAATAEDLGQEGTGMPPHP